MYKHVSESILETVNKRFISQEDKDKYDGYNDVFLLSEDAVTKSEFDEVVDNMDNYQKRDKRECITVEGSREGFVDNLEILGNTIQEIKEIIVTPEMETGTIDNVTGENYPSDVNRSRTKDYIEVEFGDKVVIDNDVPPNQSGFANILCYNKNKGFMKFMGFVNEFTVPYGCKYIRYYHRADYTKTGVIIKRTHLDKFVSVGEILGDGTFNIDLVSCRKNIIGHEWEQGSVDGIYGTLTDKCHPHFYHRIRSKKYIPINSNCTHIAYSITPDSKYKAAIRFFDENKNFIYIEGLIGFVPNLEKTVIGIPTNAKYFKIIIGDINADGELNDNVKINPDAIKPEELSCLFEYGKSVTEYEPYNESKCKINLPVQLERVGVVSDRLFKRADGVWCIEKNIQTCVLNGTEVWVKDPQQNDATQLFSCDSILKNQLMKVNNTDILSSEVPTVLNFREDIEGCYTNNQYLYLRILKEKIGGNLSNNLSNYLSENNMTVKYVLETPEIIELPLDTQITLNTFSGVTNIFAPGNQSAPVISCDIPMALGSCVVNNVNKLNEAQNRLTKIETLETSSRVRYVSDKGVTIIENSNNGIIDDIRVEGETLVNKVVSRYDTETEDEIVRAIEHISDKKYTVVNHNKVDIHLIIHETGGRWKRNHIVPANSSICIELENETIVAYSVMKDRGITLENVITLIVTILEGHYEGLKIPHFEGIRSLGEKENNGISIYTRNDAGNLFPLKDFEFKFTSSFNTWYDVKGRHYMYGDMGNKTDTAFYLEKGFYKLSHMNVKNIDLVQVVSLDDKTTLLSGSDGAELPAGYYVVRVRAIVEHSECSVSGIMLTKGKDSKEYSPMESEEKTLMYLDPKDNTYKNIPVLRKISDKILDTVEKHADGKWYYHKRCESVVLNGSEDISVSGVTNQNDTLALNIKFDNSCRCSSPSIVTVKCDKFTPVKYNREAEDVEFIHQGYMDYQPYLRIRINKSRLSTPDVQGFKQWLANNNVTAVYELINEEVYECMPLNLATYKGETCVTLNTAKIFGKVTFTTAKYLGDVIQALRFRASKIQEYILNREIYRNRMILSNTYNADQTSLKVDIISAYNNEDTEIDYELYKLIGRNISIGVDNYNRYEMEEIIDFYTMVGKLDFDMASILLDIIEKQHIPELI